jgi:glutathione reductase (NADPH)
MAKHDFDLFVIGAGSGGVRAARIAAGHGAKVGICEEYRYGGTCVIRGCVPKKLLVYASHFAEDFEDAAGYGWRVGSVEFSWPDLIEAKDREIARLEQVYIDVLERRGVQHFRERGVFLDSHRVQVGDRTLSAEKILVATGGHPWMPGIPGCEHAITSNEAFDLEELPRRIAIVGGGYVACEFAGIFNGLGAETVLVYRGDALLRGFDEDVRRVLTAEMAKKGVELRLASAITAIEKTDEGLKLTTSRGKHIEADQVMYATGRVPNVRDMGLEEAGVEQTPHGSIVVDEWSRTSQPHIFAVGDVTHRLNLTPVAIHEAHAFAVTQFGGMERPVDHEWVPSAVFSQPPVAAVGLPEDKARLHYGDLEIYRSEFRPLKHTLSGRDETTMMKLIVAKANRRVVALHIVGLDAPEIVQGFAVAVKSGLSKEQFDATIGIHPTAAEELVTMRHATRVEGPKDED